MLVFLFEIHGRDITKTAMCDTVAEAETLHDACRSGLIDGYHYETSGIRFAVLQQPAEC